MDKIGRNLLNAIDIEMSEKFDCDFLMSLKTRQGQTQRSEIMYIVEIEKILKLFQEKRKIKSYTKAGSQQPYDFRVNIKGLCINIEVKKTSSMTIMLNDTYPRKNTYYIILYCGNNTRKPEYFWKTGQELIDDLSDEQKKIMKEYSKIIKEWRQKTKSMLKSSRLKACMRGNYSINIKDFLGKK